MRPIELFSFFVLSSGIALATASYAAGDRHGHEHRSEHRDHGAHVHGIAGLNVALDADEIYVEFVSPAANILGFEHAPKSKAEHAVLDEATARLRQGNSLFQFNPEAGCRSEHAEVESSFSGRAHSDIQAIYHFECERPGDLTQLTVGLFDAFPATDEIEVQYVVENRQGATKLSPGNAVLKF